MSLQACELFLTHKVAGPLALGPGAPRASQLGSGPMGKLLGLQAQPVEDIYAHQARRCPPSSTLNTAPAARSPVVLSWTRPPMGHRGLFLPPSRGQPDRFLQPPPPPRPASGHAWKWGRGEGSRPAGKASRQAVSRLGRRRAQGKRGSPPAVFLSWGLRGGAEGHAGGSARLACLLTARPPGPIRCSSPARALSCRKHRGWGGERGRGRPRWGCPPTVLLRLWGSPRGRFPPSAALRLNGAGRTTGLELVCRDIFGESAGSRLVVASRVVCVAPGAPSQQGVLGPGSVTRRFPDTRLTV